MTTEEKAKAYDEAIKKAKGVIEQNPLMEYLKKGIEYIFPELKESEDERIKKALIEHVKGIYKGCCTEEAGKERDMFIGWLEKQNSNVDNANKEYWRGYREGKQEILSKYADLEKQGEQKETLCDKCKKEQPSHSCQDITSLGRCAIEHEQKPADNDKSKFKVGDWCIDNEDGTIFQIVKVLDNTYTYKTNEGKEYFGTHYSLENNARLWTIQDAKAGDVLACNEEILLFKSYSVQGRISLYCWYNGQTNNFHSHEVVDTLMTTRYKICPATKEQHDTLMKAMADAGYTFDFEKKELKKIEQKLDTDFSDLRTWKYIVDAVWTEKEGIGQYLDSPFTEEIAKKLQKRFGNIKQSWSEEDSRILYNVKAYIGYAAGQRGVKDELFKEANEWLNSLPIGFVYNKNYNEDMVTLLVGELKQIANDNNAPEQYQVEINWLKSLRPQKQWKPSDEQKGKKYESKERLYLLE